MKKIEVGGEVKYQFEDSDTNARKVFEASLASQDAKGVGKILAEMMSELYQRRVEAWRVARDYIKSIDPSYEGDVSYDWMTGQFSRTGKK